MRCCYAVSIVVVFVTISHVSAIAASPRANNDTNPEHPENSTKPVLPLSNIRYKYRWSGDKQDIRFLQPCEILCDSVVRTGLQELRRYGYRHHSTTPIQNPQFQEVIALTDVTFRQYFTELAGLQRKVGDSSSSVQQFATLTMVGAKGGSFMTKQIKIVQSFSYQGSIVIS